MSTEIQGTPLAAAQPAQQQDSLSLKARGADAIALLKKANTANPDDATMEALRRYYDDHPDAWRHVGDFAGKVTAAVIAAVAGSGLITEAMTRQMQAMRDGMGYATAPEMERTLIDHVVLCWLRLHKAEWSYTQVTAESITLARADFWERKLTQAQTRYLRAIETLARVRRLARPAPPMQVNIAQKQVNIATASTAAAELPATPVDDAQMIQGGP